MQKIILLRHGEVKIEDYKHISANQFGKWIVKYNNSDIKSEFSSKNEIKDILNKTDILICSSLKRSIQSIEIFNKIPFETYTPGVESPLFIILDIVDFERFK